MWASLYHTALAVGGWGAEPYTEDGDFSRHATQPILSSVTGESPVNVTRDIAYLPGNNAQHRLDVYAPADLCAADRPLLPVILHVHGGGWKRGGRGKRFYGAPYMGLEYARHGCVCVVPSYRLGEQHPSHTDDVCAALRWVLSHAHHFHGDASNVFLSGHSAGAHLVSLLVTDPAHATRNNIAHVLPRVRGVVAISGVYTLTHPFHDDEAGAGASWFHFIYKRMYITNTFGAALVDQQQASPSHFVAAAAALMADTDGSGKPPAWPPFLVVNAEADLGLEVDGARFHELLVAAAAVSHRLVVPKKTHATITKCPETVLAAFAFVRHYRLPRADSRLSSPGLLFCGVDMSAVAPDHPPDHGSVA